MHLFYFWALAVYLNVFGNCLVGNKGSGTAFAPHVADLKVAWRHICKKLI